MQAGFAMVEAGFTRAKNSGNIIMKNLMDFCIGTPLFWLVGFGIMFGSSSGFFGGIDLFTRGDYSSILPEGRNIFRLFHFPDGFLRHFGNYCFRSNGRKDKIQCLLYLFRHHKPYNLSFKRSLDLGAEAGFHSLASMTSPVQPLYIW